MEEELMLTPTSCHRRVNMFLWPLLAGCHRLQHLDQQLLNDRFLAPAANHLLG
jgi:hypothetical protein